MKIKVLDKCSKVEFKNIYDSYSIGDVEMDYLYNSVVVGGYKKGKLSAGYVLNHRASLSRILLYIPDSDSKKSNIIDFLKSDFCELTCVWISKNAKFSIHEKIAIYISMVWVASKAKKKYCIGGTVNPKIKKIQNLVLNKSLWEGRSAASNKQAYLYYVENKNIILKLIVGALRYIIMSIRKKAHHRQS